MRLIGNAAVVVLQVDAGIRYCSVTGVQTCAFPISSRRRHTRLVSDWSSDVCSSDLPLAYCVRLNSQGAVLPGNTAASVSLCRVWVLSIPRISKLRRACRPRFAGSTAPQPRTATPTQRSEEHTSELQPLTQLVCPLFL